MTLTKLSKAIVFLAPLIGLPADAQHIFVENNSTRYVDAVDVYHAIWAVPWEPAPCKFKFTSSYLCLKPLDSLSESRFLLQQRTPEIDGGRSQCLYYNWRYANCKIFFENTLFQVSTNKYINYALQASPYLLASKFITPPFILLYLFPLLVESVKAYFCKARLETESEFSLKRCPDINNFDTISSGFIWTYYSLDSKDQRRVLTAPTYWTPNTYSKDKSAPSNISGRCLISHNPKASPLLCKMDTNNQCRGKNRNIFTSAEAGDCLSIPNQMELGCLIFDYIPLDNQAPITFHE